VEVAHMKAIDSHEYRCRVSGPLNKHPILAMFLPGQGMAIRGTRFAALFQGESSVRTPLRSGGEEASAYSTSAECGESEESEIDTWVSGVMAACMGIASVLGAWLVVARERCCRPEDDAPRK
jgi:hypothetical protein